MDKLSQFCTVDGKTVLARMVQILVFGFIAIGACFCFYTQWSGFYAQGVFYDAYNTSANQVYGEVLARNQWIFLAVLLGILLIAVILLVGCFQETHPMFRQISYSLIAIGAVFCVYTRWFSDSAQRVFFDACGTSAREVYGAALVQNQETSLTVLLGILLAAILLLTVNFAAERRRA